MKENLFFPIYKKLEDEFIELSYYIMIDKRQLKVYSIKIADLILRTVSEIENISVALCNKEKIKFRDGKNKIRTWVNFNEYIDELDKIFDLKKKLVSFDFINCDSNTFISKHKPFKKTKIKENQKEKEIFKWYYAYNKIKHDRIKYFKMANLENLIDSLSALFMLNIYLKDEVFYATENDKISEITNKIESFSEVFSIDYSVESDIFPEREGFFDSKSYFEIAMPMSVYKIEYDILYKTDSDLAVEGMDRLTKSSFVFNEDGSRSPAYPDYELKDRKTLCKVLARINRKYEP